MSQPTKDTNNAVDSKMPKAENIRFRQINIVREIDNLGQAYLLLGVFEKIKIITENHNKEVRKNHLLRWFRGILNQAIAEIDEEIFKLKPRSLRRAVREMLFFREIAFDKYLNKRRHVIRLFVVPVGILFFLIAMLSALSATADVNIQHERCLHYGLTTAIASVIWILIHIIINSFLTSNKWELNFKSLWRLVTFSFFGTSLGVFTSLHKDISTGLYPALLFVISILLFITAIFDDYGQFNIKILKIFEELEKNLKDVNKSVVESTIKKAQKIITLDAKVNEAILESELKTRIYIESLKIADTILAKECEKRTRHTDNESTFIDSVTQERTNIQNILESKDINKHIGGQDLRTLLWNLANNLGQLDAKNEDVNRLKKDAGKELSRLAELVTIKGEYKALEMVNLSYVLDTVVKIVEAIPKMTVNINNNNESKAIVNTGKDGKAGDVSQLAAPATEKKTKPIHEEIGDLINSIKESSLSEDEKKEASHFLEEAQKLLEKNDESKDTRNFNLKSFLTSAWNVVKSTSPVANTLFNIAKMLGVTLGAESENKS